jgi:3-hydroxyisobutyrate dehydrogenase
VRIAYLGLGAMGRPMAANLARRFETRVWNRTAAVAADHAATHGAIAVTDLVDVAEVDVVCTCLPTDVEVAAIAAELGPSLRPGTVWIDHTSGAPAGARDVAAALEARGVHYLDAPVSGGVDGAEAGQLTVMVGGDATVLERVREVLDAVASRVVLVGPVGSGMAVKAINNALLATSLRAAAEGLVALAAAGVEAGTALGVINASSGRSFATERLIPERVLTRAFPRTFALGLLAKDVGLAMEVLRDAGVEASVLPLVEREVMAAAELLGAEADHVELVRVLERQAGVQLRGPGDGLA